MQYSINKLLIGLFLFGITGITTSQAAELPYYVYVGGGQTQIKSTGTKTYQAVTTVSVTVGTYLIKSKLALVGLEVKKDETAKEELVFDGGTPSSYRSVTQSVFLNARTSGSFYLKAKIGASQRVVTEGGIKSTDAIQSAAAVALGVPLPDGGSMEMEYTQINQDVTSLSINYRF